MKLSSDLILFFDETFVVEKSDRKYFYRIILFSLRSIVSIFFQKSNKSLIVSKPL